MRHLWSHIVCPSERQDSDNAKRIHLEEATVEELAYELQKRLVGEQTIDPILRGGGALPSHAVAPSYFLRMLVDLGNGNDWGGELTGMLAARIATTKERRNGIQFLGAVHRAYEASREDFDQLTHWREIGWPDASKEAQEWLTRSENDVVTAFIFSLAELKIGKASTLPLSPLAARKLLLGKRTRPAVYIAEKITHGNRLWDGKPKHGAYLNRHILKDLAGLF